MLQAIPRSAPAVARPQLGGLRAAFAARIVISAGLVIGAFLTTAWLSGTPPFEGARSDPYSQGRVVRALPFDTPLPQDIALAVAGYGEELPYHTQWTSDTPVAELVRQYEEHLAGSPKWRVLTTDETAGGAIEATLARSSSEGILTHFAKLTIVRNATQSVVTFDFTPVPTSAVPDPL